jgi:exosortase/archaeosortase family protein
LALCIDVYAVFKLAGLDSRPRAVSPFWLAALFALSLPIERLLQRFGGLILQDASAFGACKTLGLFFQDLTCTGTRLVVSGNEILVDLPCSGTASLMITIGAVVTLCAIHRPKPGTAIFWLGFSLGLSVFFNSLRITLLAVGVTYRDVLPVDVMANPTHGMIGLFTLSLTLLPLFLWFRPKAWVGTPSWRFPVLALPARYQAATGGLVLCVALAIVSAPRTAWDTSAEVQAPILPNGLLGAEVRNFALSDMESLYFEKYGGAARKASYGDIGVTVVRTTSPLRHLHSPEECLKGLGYLVSFVGMDHGAWPSAIYTASDVFGEWQVAVTYAANDGFVSANMSAVIWHWLKNPNTVWSSYQRITPVQFPNMKRQKLDAALMASLDVPRVLNSKKER